VRRDRTALAVAAAAAVYLRQISQLNDGLAGLHYHSEMGASMLDVHPSHHAASSWRDFFIHIATIVIGLCIAVGLEQTVEYLHHRRQVVETREALRLETRQNIRRFALETLWFRQNTPHLRMDMAILLYLRAHPHAPPESWPGSFDWGESAVPFSDAAWKTAQQDGVVEHMPAAEVQGFAEVYTRLATIRADEMEERAALEKARGFIWRDPDPAHLSPAELDKVIDDMTEFLVLHSRTAAEQTRMFRRKPEFAPAPSPDDMNATRDFHMSAEQVQAAKEGDRVLKEIDDMK
jgi:hypothetical protein